MVTLPEKPFKPVARRSTRQLWTVPRGLPEDPAAPEVMEGSGILDEFSGNRGLVLWQSYRDVMLFAGTDRKQRRQIFAKGSFARRQALIRTSGLDAEPLGLVGELALLLLQHRGAPVDDVSARVAACCGDLAEWAASVLAGATAIAFSRAAAEVSPREAAAAFRVGRTAVRFGRPTMGRTWFARAIALARRQGDWRTYGSAFLEMGAAALRRGEANEARLFYRRANRVARRSGHRPISGPALHGRARAEIDLGELDDAERHLRQALRAYRRGDPAVHAVQHDLADLLVRRGGESCVVAMGLLKSVLPTRRTPSDRVETLTLLVRAAATAHDVGALEGAWFEAVGIVSEFGETADAGRMLLDLAKATAVALEWRRQAEELARRALRIGEVTNAPFVVQQAAAFLTNRPTRRAG